jgi:hypothetical protein
MRARDGSRARIASMLDGPAVSEFPCVALAEHPSSGRGEAAIGPARF